MATYVYPASDYDRPHVLLAVLGSFWAETYQGSSQVLDVATGKGQIENQTILDLLETISALGRHAIPIFHRDNWYALRLLESEHNSLRTSPLRYDAGGKYDSGFRYDIPIDRTHHAFPVPGNLADAPAVFNRFTEPSLSWIAGIDYVLEPQNRTIVFRENPFDARRVAKREVYRDGIIVDNEAILWIFRGNFDFETAYRQFAYVLGMRLKSSMHFRDLMNAVFDAVTGGTAARQIATALSAILGIPLVLDPQEVVTNLSADANNRLVCTTCHVYKFPLSALPIVAVGDVVSAGDSLVDTIDVVELNRGDVPESLAALALGRGFIDACYWSDLVFENRRVPLEVDEDHPSGFTYVRWGLGGLPADVQKFFDDMHDRGVAEALRPVADCADDPVIAIPGDACADLPAQRIRRGTLAHLLDSRENPTSEPTAANLPKTINPLEFLVKNVLRNNAFVVRIRPTARGLGMQHMHLLRKIIPPHTAMLLVVELTAAPDFAKVDLVGETISTFLGAEPAIDSVPAGMVNADSVRFQETSLTCH